MSLKRVISALAVIVLVLLVLFASGSLVLAQVNGLEIPWYTVDGGASVSQGGDYSLSGTIGQHDAGFLSGGEFSMAGGFWVNVASGKLYLFLPVILE